MKAKKPLLILAVLLLLVAGAILYLFGGPYSFVDRSLAEPSLQHVRSGAGGASWTTSPTETAFEYLYWWRQIDRPNPSKLSIMTSYRSPDEAIVTVIDRDCQGDSTYATCDRLTLHRNSGAWLPVRHQAAWQGRGRLGWTTKPTL